MNKFTPYELSILLHYYTRPDDWHCMDAPIWRVTVDRLISLGLLERTNFIEDRNKSRSYKPTEKLFAHLEYLMSLPLPVQKWGGE
jgi:hypothetical protein